MNFMHFGLLMPRDCNVLSCDNDVVLSRVVNRRGRNPASGNALTRSV